MYRKILLALLALTTALGVVPAGAVLSAASIPAAFN